MKVNLPWVIISIHIRPQQVRQHGNIHMEGLKILAKVRRVRLRKQHNLNKQHRTLLLPILKSGALPTVILAHMSLSTPSCRFYRQCAALSLHASTCSVTMAPNSYTITYSIGAAPGECSEDWLELRSSDNRFGGNVFHSSPIYSCTIFSVFTAQYMAVIIQLRLPRVL